jgi:hypothetical protein
VTSDEANGLVWRLSGLLDRLAKAMPQPLADAVLLSDAGLAEVAAAWRVATDDRAMYGFVHWTTARAPGEASVYCPLCSDAHLDARTPRVGGCCADCAALFRAQIPEVTRAGLDRAVNEANHSAAVMDR